MPPPDGHPTPERPAQGPLPGVPETAALQDRYWPENACFGCGPRNPHGLHLKSHEDGDALVAEWEAAPRYQGPPGVVNGGMVSVPMDCHATWAAMRAFMRARGTDVLVPAVTAEYRIRLRRPTPVGRPIRLRAEAGEVQGRKVPVRVVAEVDGEVTAELEGLWVAMG